jgi:hypothetical protein
LRVNCKYLLVVERMQKNPSSVTEAEWITARRATGLDNNRADESLSRLLSEPRASGTLGEAAMAFVAHMRRLAQYGTALATATGLGRDSEASAPELQEVPRRLLKLAEQLESKSDIDESGPPTNVLSPLERQSVILHRSASRILAALNARKYHGTTVLPS